MADNFLSDQITVTYGFNDLDAIAVSVSVVFGANEQVKNERRSRDECQALNNLRCYMEGFAKLTSSVCNPLNLKLEYLIFEDLK